jgi:hypothetical protein
MEKKKDALIRMFWQRFDLWGSAPADGMILMEDATQDRLDVFWSRWQCVGLVWHTWKVAGAPEGPTFCLLDDDYALKGPTSPS